MMISAVQYTYVIYSIQDEVVQLYGGEHFKKCHGHHLTLFSFRIKLETKYCCTILFCSPNICRGKFVFALEERRAIQPASLDFKRQECIS
jgi:hypothetical protein